MIVVITIIASVATYTGISTYHDMKVSAFQKKLSVIEEKVQTIKTRAEEDKYYAEELDNLSSCTDEEIARLGINTSTVTTDYNYKENYKKITNSQLQTQIGVHHIDGEYIVNFKTGEVFSVQGIEYENNTYYSNFQIEGKEDNGWALTQKQWDFDYTGDVQEFTAPQDGTYKIECWGASGSLRFENNIGFGGYTSGNIKINKGQKLYIYTGEVGGAYNSPFNGGGRGELSGGGETDVRTSNGSWDSFNSLKSRIIVAGGGSSSYSGINVTNLGAGGGLNGYNGEGIDSYSYTDTGGNGGTQTSGGESGNNNKAYGHKESYMGHNGSFGIGGYARASGGGGGYYGGGGSVHIGSYFLGGGRRFIIYLRT